MTTQEKNKAIAEWLGWTEANPGYEDQWHPDKNRNQQKLIEDKLVEMDYEIMYDYDRIYEEWKVEIENDVKSMRIVKFNESKDIAFIDAIIELIKSK